MRETLLPIPRFLQLAIEASAASDYAGLAVVIDRAADRQSTLLQQLAVDRESVHDITADDILVIVPVSGLPPPSAGTYVLDPRKEWEDGYEAPGLSFSRPLDEESRPLDEEWATEFWTRAGEPEDWTHAEELTSAVTRSATATARFLGLDERWVPSLCVLCPDERLVSVFRYGRLDDLYDFFRPVMRRRPKDPPAGWLPDALAAAAEELQLPLQANEPPDAPSAPIDGWLYRCYGPRPTARASARFA